MSFFHHLIDWLPVINGVIASASLAANLTPNKTDNLIIKLISSTINTLALNFKETAK